MLITDETICAVSTASGVGAIAIVRVAGPKAIAIVDKIFVSANNKKRISEQKGGTFHYGTIVDATEAIDEVVVLIYRAPHSFTGEDMVEISCHGAEVIQFRIVQVLLKNGARMAGPGEFTRRAFANGKMDLSQAEAVADLISSQSDAARRVALQQLKGGLSKELHTLREKLLQLCTLLELELDFSEEDVEFADRTELIDIAQRADKLVTSLANSFQAGNAIKNGVPVAIVGPTNAGKSTLLNTLLNEERAIVSDVHGTTRDAIEDTIVIKGINFRFIDTAGLRQTTDKVEQIGIERTYDKISKASIIMSVFDLTSADISATISKIDHHINRDEQKWIVVLNKVDIVSESVVEQQKQLLQKLQPTSIISISAKNRIGIDELSDMLISVSGTNVASDASIITNMRHYEALIKSHEALKRTINGLQSGISGELVAMDLHEVIDELASITGEMSSQEVLNNIFAHFCIGK